MARPGRGAKETQLFSIPMGWDQDPDLACKTWLNAACMGTASHRMASLLRDASRIAFIPSMLFLKLMPPCETSWRVRPISRIMGQNQGQKQFLSTSSLRIPKAHHLQASHQPPGTEFPVDRGMLQISPHNTTGLQIYTLKSSLPPQTWALPSEELAQSVKHETLNLSLGFKPHIGHQIVVGDCLFVLACSALK